MCVCVCVCVYILLIEHHSDYVPLCTGSRVATHRRYQNSLTFSQKANLSTSVLHACHTHNSNSCSK